jgi:cell fate (sporulation/competence/biofilm development) regulator YlbF (YheA/YmcA/DUF963 family)
MRRKGMAESNLREAALRLGAVLSDADDEAMRLIEKQASLQQAVRTRQSEGSISIADLEELNQLQEAVSSKVSKYLGAQQEAKGLLTAVNGEISRLCGFSFVSFARTSDCWG